MLFEITCIIIILIFTTSMIGIILDFIFLFTVLFFGDIGNFSIFITSLLGIFITWILFNTYKNEKISIQTCFYWGMIIDPLWFLISSNFGSMVSLIIIPWFSMQLFGWPQIIFSWTDFLIGSVAVSFFGYTLFFTPILLQKTWQIWQDYRYKKRFAKGAFRPYHK